MMRTERRCFLRVGTGVVLVAFFFSGCGGGGGEGGQSDISTPPEDSRGSLDSLGDSTAVVTIDLPPGVQAQDWDINTAMVGRVSLPNGASQTPIRVRDADRQFVWASHLGQFAMAAIKEPGQSSIPMSALSTATALLALNPILIQPYTGNPEQMRSLLESDAKVQALSQLIASRLSDHQGLFGTDFAIRTAANDALKSVLDSLFHPSESGQTQSRKVEINPETVASGVTIAKERVENGKLTVKIENPRGRWVGAFVETNGETSSAIIPSGSFVNFTAPNIALLQSPLAFNSSGEGHLTFPLQVFRQPEGWKSVEESTIKLYAGLGTGMGKSETWPRVIVPLLLTLLDNWALPVIDVVSGIQEVRNIAKHHDKSPAVAKWLERLHGWFDSRFPPVAEVLAGWERSWELYARIVKIVVSAVGMLFDNDMELLIEIAKELLFSALEDVGVEALKVLFKRLAPGIGLVWTIWEALESASTIVLSSAPALTYPVFEEIQVRNLPPAIEVSASEHIDSLQFVFHLSSPYPLLYYSWDFDDDGIWEKEGKEPGQEWWTYGKAGVYRAKVKGNDVDYAKFEKEIVIVPRPSDLQASAKAPSSLDPVYIPEVTLSWKDNTAVMCEFSLERTMGGADNRPVLRTVTAGGSESVTYSDTSVRAGGTYEYKVRAFYRTPEGTIVPSEYSNLVEVTLPDSVRVATTELPGGLAGRAYQASLEASGGSAPYAWSLAGSLPAGLQFLGIGSLQGTTTESGRWTFTAIAQDTKGVTGRKSLTLQVSSNFAIVTPSTLPEIVGPTPSSIQLEAVGGTPPYDWRWYANGFGHHIPLGLDLNPGSGAIAGTPAESGTMKFIVEVTDAMGVIARKTFELAVRPRITEVRLFLCDQDQAFANWDYKAPDHPRVDLVVNGRTLDSGISLTGSFKSWDLLTLFPSLSDGGSLEIKVKVVGTGGYWSSGKWYDRPDVNIGVWFSVISKPYPVGWGSSFASWTPFELGGRLKQGEEKVVSTTLKP